MRLPALTRRRTLAARRLERDRKGELGFRNDVLDQLLSRRPRYLPVEQTLFREHDHAMQRGPDLQGLPLAQQADGRSSNASSSRAKVSIAAT